MVAMSHLLLVLVLAAGVAAGDAEPDQGGALRMVSCSLFGGTGDERIAGVALQSDRSVVAVGSCTAPFAVPGLAVPAGGEANGFILRLDAWGKPLSLAFLPKPLAVVRIGPEDRICVRAEDGEITIVDADARKRLLSFTAPPADGVAMDVDNNGAMVVASGKQLLRFDPAGRQLWAATPPAHGNNRLRACAIEPATGISIAVGYGMTHTGKEPYKDPYAHGFDRSGKLVWTLWNPDPGDQKSAEFGGTGLMADGTGDGAACIPGGGFLVRVFHDGGNAVTTRDPKDPRQPLDRAIFAGSYQAGPGHGMQGAITTSVIFRVDPATGTLLKGTWMCAWMNNRSRANSLSMSDAAADEAGNVYIAGSSAWELSERQPWLPFRSDEYRGGAFLAAFDEGFAMHQCGAFNPGDLDAVAARDGVVVVAGRAKGQDKKGVPIPATLQMRLLKPAAQATVAGASDACLVILHRAGANVPQVAAAKSKVTAAGTRTATGPAKPAATTNADPAWNAFLLTRLAVAVQNGRKVDIEAFGERRLVLACSGQSIGLRQGDGELAIKPDMLTMEQRLAVACQLATGNDSADLLLAAYYLRLKGEARDSAIALAKAGRSEADLQQPPTGSTP
jgi:hypothetical protein